MAILGEDFRTRKRVDPGTRLPAWLWKPLSAHSAPRIATEVVMNVREHLYGPAMADAFRRCRERLDLIEVDRLRVKPVVKITGEFWAQSTEGDGNFRMFEFLEREGAQVIVDPLSTWLMYMLGSSTRRSSTTAA